MKSWSKLIFAIVSPLVLALVACGGQGQQILEQAANEMADAALVIEAAADEVMPEAGGILPDLGGREITVAVENTYLPFNYIDPQTGEPAGWDYEAIGAICEVINCVPVYVEVAREDMIQAVADGQYDMAAGGITITSDRAEIVDFSQNYINIEHRFLARSDETRFTTIDEFVANSDLVLGTQTGTTNYETASTILPTERIRTFEQFPFAVEALLADDVDAVILDETAGQGYFGVSADQLKPVGESLSSDALGFIFPKGSDLVGPVNAALRSLSANGTMDALAERFFTDQFTITYDDLGG